MVYLIAVNWGWLLATFLLGLGMGWIAVVHRAGGVSKRTMLLLSILAVALVALAVSRVIPGRAGYWLELLLLMFAPYIVGCAIGSPLRNWVIMRSAPTA